MIQEQMSGVLLSQNAAPSVAPYEQSIIFEWDDEISPRFIVKKRLSEDVVHDIELTNDILYFFSFRLFYTKVLNGHHIHLPGAFANGFPINNDPGFLIDVRRYRYDNEFRTIFSIHDKREEKDDLTTFEFSESRIESFFRDRLNAMLSRENSGYDTSHCSFLGLNKNPIYPSGRVYTAPRHGAVFRFEGHTLEIWCLRANEVQIQVANNSDNGRKDVYVVPFEHDGTVSFRLKHDKIHLFSPDETREIRLTVKKDTSGEVLNIDIEGEQTWPIPAYPKRQQRSHSKKG